MLSLSSYLSLRCSFFFRRVSSRKLTSRRPSRRPACLPALSARITPGRFRRGRRRGFHGRSGRRRRRRHSTSFARVALSQRDSALNAATRPEDGDTWQSIGPGDRAPSELGIIWNFNVFARRSSAGFLSGVLRLLSLINRVRVRFETSRVSIASSWSAEACLRA